MQPSYQTCPGLLARDHMLTNTALCTEYVNMHIIPDHHRPLDITRCSMNVHKGKGTPRSFSFRSLPPIVLIQIFVSCSRNLQLFLGPAETIYQHHSQPWHGSGHRSYCTRAQGRVFWDSQPLLSARRALDIFPPCKNHCPHDSEYFPEKTFIVRFLVA